jgi:polar amino acid transport system substrate-binding protein
MTDFDDLERRLRSESADERRLGLDALDRRMTAEIDTRAASATLPRSGRLTSPGLAGLGGLTAAVIAIVLAVTVVGPWLATLPRVATQTTQPSASDLLETVTDRGVIRIGVRPDHPQLDVPGAGLSGFDIDVANEIGRRLGLRAEIVIIAADEMGGRLEAGEVDVVMPSATPDGLGLVDVVESRPYYFWDRYLVVDGTSSATSVADLDGRPVCAVAGDAGVAWLTAGAGQGLSMSVVQRPSDDACLAALASGEVDGLVTSALTLADLRSRPSLTVVGGPPTEARSLTAARRTDPDALIREIDRAIDALRSDGSLSRLSQNRFGGLDLSSPPSSS